MQHTAKTLEAAGVRVNVRPFGFELLGHGHRVLVADLQALDRHDIAALTGTQRPRKAWLMHWRAYGLRWLLRLL